MRTRRLRRVATTFVGVLSGLATFAGHHAIARAENPKSSRVESDPVIYPSGDRVSLPVLGASVELPPSPGGWAINVAKETANSWDVLRRMEPGLPALTFDFTHPSLKCAEAAALFDKVASVMTRIDSPNFVPAMWEAWAYALPADDEGKTSMKICTNTPQGPVMASVIYEGSPSAIDPARTRPLLEAIGKAVAGHRSTGAGPSGSVATALTPLTVTGITISLPANWSAGVYGQTADERTDVLERKVPATPDLFLLVKRGPQCNLGQAAGNVVQNPAYLPEGWGGRAVESFHENDNTNSALFCGRTKSGDFVVGSLTYLGTLGSPDMMEVKPILASILAQVGPAESSVADHGSPDDDDDDEGSNRELYSLFELGIAQYDPAFSGSEKSLGVTLGYNAFGITNDRHQTVGGAWKISTQLGYGKDSWIPYDVQVGLGVGLQFGKVAIAPLVGIGIDGAGGADETKATYSKITAGGYWFVGLEGKITVSSFGISLGIESIRRRAEGNSLEDGLDKETRVSMRFILRNISIGVQYLAYGTSVDPRPDDLPRIIQGMFGFHL